MIRAPIAARSAISKSYPAIDQQPIALRGLIPSGGNVLRYYSAWYRNAATFCTAATFNYANAISVSWVN